MKLEEAISLLDAAMVRRRLLYRSQQTYRGCVRRFLRETQRLFRSMDNDSIVSEYLSSHAADWAEATQSQALNAIVFFFAHALEKPLGKLPDWARARRPARLPVWLSETEALAVLAHLRDEMHLAAGLMYGGGPRVTETFRIRRRDVNWAEATLAIRDGKGGKDRVTCLPISLMEELRAQDARAEDLWRWDREENVGPVWVPDCVRRKQPKAGFHPGNYWLFPARGLIRDEARWGRARHHIHPDTFAKALAWARDRAGILKRVTAHVFRHSFATQFLLNGGNIRALQELLGHTHIDTTMRYLHCLPRLAARIESPLDRKPGNVIALPPLTPCLEPERGRQFHEGAA